MQAMPNMHATGDSPPTVAPFLVRRRSWLYLVILLLAIELIAFSQRTTPSPAGRLAAATKSARPAGTQPAVPDDSRPLLLPDR